jgi:hypothetical protein
VSRARVRTGVVALFLVHACALPLLAQHDITHVEEVAPDAAASTPMPDKYERRLKKYDLPELSGAKQAVGPQLLDGNLRKPLIDFDTLDGVVEQRISIFEEGLVVVKMTGAASIRKKVLLSPESIRSYVNPATPQRLAAVDPRKLDPPADSRRALVRAYNADRTFVERTFHPGAVLDKELADLVNPLRDLLRAISEDRGVTTTLANYQPKKGDQLVADDHKVWRVERVIDDAGVVELHCEGVSTVMYIVTKDLHLYFLGAKPRG